MTISIITATYNSDKTLRDTLDSVLRQTYSDYEHIIIDGASSDDTLMIVREYEAHYKGRLRYISEPDKGLYDAMNKGVRMATGDVVGILNSDDFYSSDGVLSLVAENMENPNIDAVYGDVHYVRATNLQKCIRYFSSHSFRRWKMRMGFIPAHPSFYCRRAVYEKYGAFDETFEIAGDFENLLRLIFVHRINIQYLPLDFVTMRIGGASSSGLKSYKQGFKEHLRAYRKNGVYSNVLLESVRYICRIFDLTIQKLKKLFDK